ncbi:hypothetical protein U9M48_013273 [Paspalum notatum var. saurae]|uniref:Integrase catalytic domain-containing protein n=1 Tax=Paspalum notatum var. saurae TaxID=547442 RepID=A0AAQ3SZ65_PASNO
MEDVWIMDFGCSRHMTGHRKWFSSLNPVSTKEYITFGDNGQGKVMGVGSVSFCAKLSLREVAFVRNLGFNLVSVSQLLDEGYEVRFKKGACCVLDAEETLVCSLLPFGQVFRVDVTYVSGPARCLVASPSADIWKWHRRLGHLSFDLLVRLSSMGLIRGLPKLSDEKDLVCHPCRHGKMVAASHIPVSQVMTSYPGELLHMDTVGPARVASVSGKWYVLVVVDDFSRFSWVFFMESMDEAFGFVWDLVLRLRNESHKAMRAIRSDNGGEFRNSRFENFCRDLGLEHQFSSPYSPPQNGVVERKNRTLVEMARTMLDEHRTPRHFWAEAVNTACYIANRIFLRAFLGKTLYELRFGDDEEGTPIFEDEEGVVNDGDAGATAPAAAPAPSATSSDDEGGPLPTVSSSLPRQQAHAEAGPADDAGEVTSEIVPSRQVQRNHPPYRIIGDIHQCVTHSSVNSLAFFSHSAYVASFEPRNVSHALSDPNWVNAMHEELENFERNHVWDLVKPPPNCRLIARLEAIRILLAFAASKGFKLQQMDVKSAFLNGFIEEEVYVRQPPGFESARFPDRMYKLRKALNGLEQAPRAWYTRLKSFLLKSGFVMGSMSRKFEMSLMGELQFFLGLQIKQGPEGTFVHQAKYTRDILKKFEMGDSKPMTTPMSSSLFLRGFSDADRAGCRIDRKSSSGTCQLLGTSFVSWSSRKQASVSLSTTEAEYIAAATCCSQLLWIKATLSDFDLRLQVEGVDNALIKGEIESQWTGLIALLMVNTRNRGNGPKDNNQANGNPPQNPLPLTADQSFQLQMQMMATLNNAVQALQNVQANPQPQQRDRRGDFMKGHPPTFSHSANPLQADDWLRAVERQLDITQCNDQERVMYAAGQLRGATPDWSHHVPAGIMKMKKNEFLSLKQGNMSVTEYCDKFLQLARYAPAEVAEDSDKQEHFLEGLNDNL